MFLCFVLKTWEGIGRNILQRTSAIAQCKFPESKHGPVTIPSCSTIRPPPRSLFGGDVMIFLVVMSLQPFSAGFSPFGKRKNSITSHWIWLIIMLFGIWITTMDHNSIFTWLGSISFLIFRPLNDSETEHEQREIQGTTRDPSQVSTKLSCWISRRTLGTFLTKTSKGIAVGVITWGTPKLWILGSWAWKILRNLL